MLQVQISWYNLNELLLNREDINN